MTAAMTAPSVGGSVKPGFEPVRDAFVENFTARGELGGAVCVYRHGEPVVDLWGGVRTRAGGEPWREDTMVLVYSTTKGLSALAMALAHSRGLFDYDERVAAYWPEFAQAGKEAITLRQLLDHKAGLFGFDERVDWDVVADLDRLARSMERQRPAWAPGERQAYHAITLGFYESELLRRVDPLHRTIGRFFDDEIARPLGADFYIRLPESIPADRLAPLEPAGAFGLITSLPLRSMIDVFNPRAVLHRSLVSNPGTSVPTDRERVYRRNFEVPSGGGVGSARGIARAYGAFAAGGASLGIRPETLRELEAAATPARRGFYDECFRAEVAYSLGFMKPSPLWPFGSPRAYGAPGAGGSLGFADPETGIGYGYVTNRMGTDIAGDPRDVALRNAVKASLAAIGTGGGVR